MKAYDLLESIGSIRDKYILEAHSQKAVQHKRVPAKRVFLIAAIIALMLLLVGCVVVILGLQDLNLGRFSYDAGFGETQSGDLISMQGFAGSPEYQAAKEWQEFLAGYDADRSIINEVGNNPTNLDSKYTLYKVYTQEMCDKLDEIAQKYDLELHSVINIVDREELDSCVGGEFMGPGLSRGWAYIYEDGTFQFDGDAQLGNTQLLFQCRRSVKGTLDEVVLNIGNMNDYQESQYQTSSGETVILARKPNRGLIIADFEACFITVNVLGSTELDLTETNLKYIADAIDFSVLKHVIAPDLRGDASSGSNDDNGSMQTKPIDEAISPIQEAFELSDDPRINAYQSVLLNVMQRQAFPEGRELGYDGYDMSQNKFAVYDIDGDGADELLFAYTTTYTAGMAEIIYDLDRASGTVREQFFEFPFVTYYENGIIEAGWSHNHGLGGRFWPYTLYQYDPDADAYEKIASVDAWDKSVAEQDSEGNPFPDSIDQDGDWLVYFIMTDESMEYGTPVDYSEYEKWRRSYLGDLLPIKVPYRELTEGNIVSAAMPAGIQATPDTIPEQSPGNREEWEMASSKFESILSGDGLFFDPDLCEGVTIDGYCKSFGSGEGMDVSITKYTLADLEEDGIPELILGITINESNDYGVLVLRYDSGVTGYTFAHRQMGDIKMDGTFHYSGGASNNGTARIEFHDHSWDYVRIGGVEESGDNRVSYFWNGTEISEEAYWQWVAQQETKENAQWIAYPSENYSFD